MYWQTRVQIKRLPRQTPNFSQSKSCSQNLLLTTTYLKRPRRWDVLNTFHCFYPPVDGHLTHGLISNVNVNVYDNMNLHNWQTRNYLQWNLVQNVYEFGPFLKETPGFNSRKRPLNLRIVCGRLYTGVDCTVIMTVKGWKNTYKNWLLRSFHIQPYQPVKNKKKPNSCQLMP